MGESLIRYEVRLHGPSLDKPVLVFEVDDPDWTPPRAIFVRGWRYQLAETTTEHHGGRVLVYRHFVPRRDPDGVISVAD